jgi:hypothetical protein
VEEEIMRRDGRSIVQRKGSIRLFEEWIRKCFQWQDVEEAVNIIVKPFREVRKLRQKPAHFSEENIYSPKYEERQHQLLDAIYGSVSQLRFTLARHPRSPDIDVPNYLRDGNIVFF